MVQNANTRCTQLNWNATDDVKEVAKQMEENLFGGEVLRAGLANAVGRISGILAPYAVAVLLDNYGVTGVFVLLGSVSVIVAAVIAVIGIETKGVSIESINSEAVKVQTAN